MKKPAIARVVTEPLGGSALSLAVQAGKLPGEIQPWRPVGVEQWRSHADRIRSAVRPDWYSSIAPAIAASDTARARVEASAGGRGIVITTGQQAGLFGGPLYTLAKALSALALADCLSRELGMPVAPIFWAATDDADFREASIAHVADAAGLRELRLREKPAAGTPMAAAPLRDMAALLDELRAACGSAAHGGYFNLARSCFAEGQTIGGAYVRFMRGLLEPLGIAVLDSSHPSYLSAARPLLRDALASASLIAEAGAERAAAIRASGFEPQVEDDRGLSLVFATEQGARRRLTVAEAGDLRVTNPHALAPNVLLRPLVEGELLPTAAYVAGPGELAYFTQTNAVAAALGRDRVVGVPRWSGTVIEPFAAVALDRLGATYEELSDLPALERRLATAAMPPPVAEAWSELQDLSRRSMDRLRGAVIDASLVPPAVVDGLERSIAHRLGRAERRLLAAVKRRDERVRQDLQVAAGALFPGGHRQERVLNYVPMLARGGQRLLDGMLDAAREHAGMLVGADAREAVAPR